MGAIALKAKVEKDTKKVGTDIYKMSQKSIYYSCPTPNRFG